MDRPIFQARAPRVLGVCLGLAISGAAWAQSVDPRTALAAQALYDQASTEMDAKNYASACPKLEEVTRLVPEGIGARLTLAECYQGLGKLASAWSQFALVQTLAARAGQPERSQKAAIAAEALKPKLATLAFDVAAAARSIPGLVITRDGVTVGQAQWGTPLPVDVGPHEVVAAAPGYRTWKKPVEVVTDGVPLVFEVKALEVDREAKPRAVPAGPAETALPPPPPRPWQRPVGLAASVTGGTGVVLGGLLGVLAIVTRDKSNQDNHCDASNTCDPIGLGIRREAVALGHASTASLVAGAAVLAGGVVMFLTAPPERKAAKSGQRAAWSSGVTASLGVSFGGMQIAGQW